MKSYLISFGSEGYSGTLNNLKNSASNYFDEIIIYGEKDILELQEKFPKHFSDKRGYGYWLWKPYLILKTMKEVMFENDIIFYTDATINFVNNPKKLIEIVDDEEILLFSSRYKNNQWVRYDTFYLMGCLSDIYVNGEHANCAFVGMKNTKKSISFLEEFFYNCSNYEIISDTLNKYGNNFEGFNDNRHDQSIISLMAIKHGINLHRDPSQWGENQKSLFTNSNYPTIINHHRMKY